MLTSDSTFDSYDSGAGKCGGSVTSMQTNKKPIPTPVPDARKQKLKPSKKHKPNGDIAAIAQSDQDINICNEKQSRFKTINKENTKLYDVRSFIHYVVSDL